MALPDELAAQILESFNLCYDRFLSITRESGQRFVNADWLGVQVASRERLQIYDGRVAQISNKLRKQKDCLEVELWRAIKQSYQQQTVNSPCRELAESFYNSTYGKMFHHQFLTPPHAFVWAGGPPPEKDAPLHHYRLVGVPLGTIAEQILSSSGFIDNWHDKAADIEQLAVLLRKQLERFPGIPTLEILKPIFYRNKGAYMVGRLFSEHISHPFIICLINREGEGVMVDAVLTERDQVSILFGFARSYFMVDIPAPSSVVAFLRHLLPHKSDAELYSAIGCLKHSKTQFYRHYLHHLEHSSDQFDIAPGIPGLVMSVFTLPSFDVVFKVIRDKFGPSKGMSRQQVKAKYRLVKQHDRVGRMADTQDFANFRFPKRRLSDALLAELRQTAPSSITETHDLVIIKHLYIERRMVPLNLYLDQASESQANAALIDYGWAIKEMAAANIFPGDLLLKNFGVTRHGRVIFYDYDEVCYLIDCNFRRIPEPLYPEQEMQAEPWYSVAENDIFPEEFATFVTTHLKHRQVLQQYHPNLFEADWWKQVQSKSLRGHFEEFYPYPESCCFKNHKKSELSSE
ncbi:bifunctional isocitrate dehydrogenase kinase/phosphatase [Corallincola spongiicola]|uniref:Isocitrate dehydrogenase kinase/phosphatase n=1 Tax=Corallincola spongiicola TaxID=2520508 RepID=A0ABY1WRE8_9GAMM|nr:bifunctional isocitrate dehydrogenase kinase/phosphatase [Corallincola spongiicola]TAA47296.1 bifunctional isocitrate dehydrogenase kinase/phosphatase [Corallincola spongiicola]